MKNLLIAVTLVLTSFAASAASFVESNSLNVRLQITTSSTKDYWVEFNFGNDLCLKGDKNDALPMGTRIINGTKIHFDTKCSYNIDGQVVIYPSTRAGIEKLVEIVNNSDVLKWEHPRGVEVFDLKDLDKSFLKFRGGI